MNENFKKGLIFGIIGNVIVAFQPILAVSKPASLDNYLFAAMTVIVEATIFLPIMLIELRRIKSKSEKNNEEVVLRTEYSLLKNWKKNFWLFLVIGLIFGVNQILFFFGYQASGAILGSLTQKTTIFFGLLFGYLILKERITKTQIGFSILLFFGLTVAITQGFTGFGSFDLTVMIGVLILLFIACLWMFGHSINKPILDRNEATPVQMVFIRNFISGIILFSSYLIFFPLENLSQLLIPINQIYFLVFGAMYSVGLFCWYKTLTYLEVSKATILFSSTPILTALFATIFLGEIFSIFHLIGMIIVIFSIIMIVRQKEEPRSGKDE